MRSAFPSFPIGAIVAGIAIGAGAAAAFQRARAPSPSFDPVIHQDSVRTEIAALQGELRSLRREVAALRTRTTLPRAVVGAAPAAELDAAPALAPTETPSSPRDPVDVAAELEVDLASETVDRAWSATQTTSMRQAIDTFAAGTTIRDVHCASSLCRVSLDHDTDEAQRQLGPSIAEQPPFHAGVFYVYERPAPPFRTTLYVSRERSASDAPN